MARGFLALQTNTRDNRMKTSDLCGNGKNKRNNTYCFHVRVNPSFHNITCNICKLNIETTNNVSRSSIPTTVSPRKLNYLEACRNAWGWDCTLWIPNINSRNESLASKHSYRNPEMLCKLHHTTYDIKSIRDFKNDWCAGIHWHTIGP